MLLKNQTARGLTVVGIVCLAITSLSWGIEPDLSADAVTFSLADDFSLEKQTEAGVWSIRLIDRAKAAPAWPALAANERTANDLWGSSFDPPPRMWSEAAGYWGIGRNDIQRDLVSKNNDTTWSPGKILLHAKEGESPGGLAICWTAPRKLWIDVRYSFALAAKGSNGVGFRLAKHSRGADAEIVSVQNIGQEIVHELQQLEVSTGDMLTFEIDDSGEPAGDIVQADVVIKGRPAPKPGEGIIQPGGGVVMEGSRFTFASPAAGTKSLQWRKEGQAIPGATAVT